MNRFCFGLLLVLPIVAGCGPGEGKVSGRVTLDGVPVPAGRVTFRPADPKMNSVSAEIDEQGNYPPVVLPAGEVKVSVDNREWEPQPALGGGPLPPGLPPDVQKALGGGEKPADGKTKASPKYVKIPERYYDIETSDLKFTVPRGDLKKDLELKK